MLGYVDPDVVGAEGILICVETLETVFTIGALTVTTIH